MTFNGIDAWWWPYLFILIAGWMATDSWRFLGVFLGGRISENSDVMVFVRAMATALVAAVIANLIVFPSGALADTPAWLRIAAAATAFGVYLGTGKTMLAGLIAGEAVLVAGIVLL